MPSGVPRFAVALTVVPSRLRTLTRLIEKIEQWRIQPSRIFLTVCSHYRRFNRGLSPAQIPRRVAEHPKVEILWREDLGPITKIFWVLLERRSDFDFILTLDDDRDYPPTIPEDLLAGAKSFPGAAIGLRGRAFRRGTQFSDTVSVVVPPDGAPRRGGKRVDFLLGTEGALYPTRPFDSSFFDLFLEKFPTSAHLHFVDDIYIAGYLAKRGIASWVVQGSAVFGEMPRWSIRRFLAKALSLHFNALFMDDRLWAINRRASYHDQAISFWTDAWSTEVG